MPTLALCPPRAAVLDRCAGAPSCRLLVRPNYSEVRQRDTRASACPSAKKAVFSSAGICSRGGTRRIIVLARDHCSVLSWNVPRNVRHKTVYAHVTDPDKSVRHHAALPFHRSAKRGPSLLDRERQARQTLGPKFRPGSVAGAGNMLASRESGNGCQSMDPILVWVPLIGICPTLLAQPRLLRYGKIVIRENPYAN